MIRHVWSVLCARSIIDNESNNISLLEVLEQLAVTAPPGQAALSQTDKISVPLNSELVTLWTRSGDVPEQSRARIRIVNAGGDELHVSEIAVDLTKHARLRSRARLNGLAIRGPGVHEFRVSLEEQGRWEEVARIPLQIIFGPPPTSP
ncbi:MAG: hypothetical protein Q7S58_13285 [Candidatus Binatus sp.]|uniref:hypothetical protein n=1 Tax=Candidatus Binatus sp. TaxID=2811406 RepID=UPI00271F806B|nr:hypothetical protein [Candidatus Binatus sp.]MDO8433371.1 hypothetical protein [Candidatus Binatus sp.]